MMEILDGSKHSPQLGKDPNIKKMTNLLLLLCSTFVGLTKVAILDPGFCVLKEIVELNV